MSFNRLFQIFLMPFLMSANISCSQFLSEKKKEEEVFDFSNQKLTCLKDLPANLQKLSVGEAENNEINSGFDCVRDSLTYFKDKTYGAMPNSYTSDEIRNFFAKYFLKENKVTPEFAAELMKIKKALLGGSEASISKDEILQLVDLLALVRDEFVQLSPHLKILLAQQQIASWEEVSAATEQLNQSLQKIMAKTQLVHSEYGLQDLKKALTGLSDFIRGAEVKSAYDLTYDQLKNSVPLMEAIKNVFVGRHPSLINLYQWNRGLDNLIKVYDLYLKKQYVINTTKFVGPRDLAKWTLFANQGFKLLDQALLTQPSGLIPAEDIDELIDQGMVALNSLMQTPIQTSSLKKVYRVAAMRILSSSAGQNSNQKMDSRSFVGIEKKHLAGLEREFNIWQMDQSLIDSRSTYQFFTEKFRNDPTALAETFLAQYYADHHLKEDLLQQEGLRTSLADFLKLMNGQIQVNFNDRGRLIEVSATEKYPFTWKSLTKINFMRALSRMLMLGYAENPGGALTEARLSKQGLISWYGDFNELGLDLQAFDPRKVNSGPSSFLEANLFTFSGNGDEWMDQSETFEFVSLLFSAGLSSSDQMQQDMKECFISEKDIFGYSYMKEDCFKKRLRQNFADYFDNLPGMTRYVKSLNDTDFDIFYRYLKSSSTVSNQKLNLIETENIRTMVTILHYIESLFVIFDKDRSSGLSLSEVEAATPRFNSFLKVVSTSQNDIINKEGFSFLVFNGKMPHAMDLIKFQAQKTVLKEATRFDILRIFSIFTDEFNK